MDPDEPIVIRREISHTPSVHEDDVGYEWNSNHETLFKQWAERSQYYSIMHDRSGKHYGKLHKWMGIPSKILLTMIGSIQFSQLSDMSNVQWSLYLTGFLSMIALMISMARDFYNFESLSHQHLASAAVYDRMYMNIASQLVYTRGMRTNVRSYMRSVRSKLADVKQTSPPIPSHILNEYVTELDHMCLRKICITGGGDDRSGVHNQSTQDPQQNQSTQQSQQNPSTPPTIEVRVDSLRTDALRVDACRTNALGTDSLGTDTNSLQPIGNNGPIGVPSTSPISDIQDEFAAEMERKLKVHRQQLEEYNLARFAETKSKV